MQTAIPVTVADTYTYSCLGLQEMIRRKSPIKPFPATDMTELFSLIETNHAVWAVLTDEFLSKFGIDSITTISKKYPAIKICILTACENIHHLHHLESLGVKALVHKSTLGREIKEAILNHSGDEIYLCPVISKIYYQHMRHPSSRKKILSDRQAEIIPLLIARLKRHEIAEKLKIKPTSVNTQCTRIYEKKERFQFESLVDLARADGIII